MKKRLENLYLQNPHYIQGTVAFNNLAQPDDYGNYKLIVELPKGEFENDQWVKWLEEHCTKIGGSNYGVRENDTNYRVTLKASESIKPPVMNLQDEDLDPKDLRGGDVVTFTAAYNKYDTQGNVGISLYSRHILLINSSAGAAAKQELDALKAKAIQTNKLPTDETTNETTKTETDVLDIIRRKAQEQQ